MAFKTVLTKKIWCYPAIHWEFTAKIRGFAQHVCWMGWSNNQPKVCTFYIPTWHRTMLILSQVAGCTGWIPVAATGVQKKSYQIPRPPDDRCFTAPQVVRNCGVWASVLNGCAMSARRWEATGMQQILSLVAIERSLWKMCEIHWWCIDHPILLY